MDSDQQGNSVGAITKNHMLYNGLWSKATIGLMVCKDFEFKDESNDESIEDVPVEFQNIV